MSDIASLCDEIMKQTTAMGMQTANSMLPGLSKSKIRRLTASLPIVLPESVVELYEWSEGAGPRSDDFFPGFGMNSLPEMIQMYGELSNAPDYPRFRYGEVQWFPIFRSGGTDFYGVCCTDTTTFDGEVVYDDNEGAHRDCITPPPVAYLSIEAMLRTLLRAYETGAYYIDERGQLTVGICSYNEEGQLVGVDMSKFNEVARQLNPGLKRWE